jgi:hypothetical protein
MANWKFSDPRIGLPSMTSIVSCTTTTSLNSTGFPVGTITRAEDASLGNGEFVYLPGVASNTVGSLVYWNQSSNVVTLSPTTGNSVRPVAVSMAANTSTTALSWYQIFGAATIKKTAVKISPDVAIYVSATAGRIKAVASAGLQVLGARTINAATVASATSTVLVLINRPHLQGQIT